MDRAVEIALPPGPGNVKNEMCPIAPHRIDMGIKAAWFQLFTFGCIIGFLTSRLLKKEGYNKILLFPDFLR